MADWLFPAPARAGAVAPDVRIGDVYLPLDPRERGRREVRVLSFEADHRGRRAVCEILFDGKPVEDRGARRQTKIAVERLVPKTQRGYRLVLREGA